MALSPTVTAPMVARGFDPTVAPEIQERLFSGFASFEFSTPVDSDKGSRVSGYTPRGSEDCGGHLGSNVRVNQGCLNVSDPDLQGRAQAQNETSIAINPNNSKQLVASQNDYRRGDGNCYSGYSTDSGRTWNDSTIPMSFTRGRANFGAAREYWQAGGDTSVAWDSKGNAYLSCQVFNRGTIASRNSDVSSALLVFRSQNRGASWNFPGRYVRVSADVTNDGVQPFLDKQLITVDSNPGSPFQDRVYVTWTEFAADGSAYIYEAYSADYAEHFSTPRLVSKNAPGLCTVTFGVPTTNGSSCNENQFSQPFTGTDGNLYVVFANFNNSVKGNDNRNQMLLAKSVDGGNTFSPPIKVADYYDLPDCATNQGGKNFGRACVPEKGPTTSSYFRAANYPSGAVDPTNPARLVVSLGSYINSHSNESNGCIPTGLAPGGNNAYTGVKTAGACNNDILISVSNDGGLTFTGTLTDPRSLTSATPDAGQATSDQFWQWLAFTKNGKLAISYFDRQYGGDETTGFSDVSLSGSGDLTNFAVNRVTSSSMPPPTQFGGLFFGDYTGLAADTNAHPYWMDTRNPDVFTCGLPGPISGPPSLCSATVRQGGQALVANDQDVYTANMPVPSR